MVSRASSSAGARRAIRRLTFARLVSVSGSQAAQIALVFEIYEQTKSGVWVVAALIASVTVNGLLGPASGWVADRFERRRVMIVSELAGAAAYAALAFVHGPVLLITGVFLATVLGAPFRSASIAAVPNLVEVESLAWANSLLQTAFNIGLVAGPLVGGAIVAASGTDAVFTVNAATFVVSALLITVTTGDFGGGEPLHRVREEGEPHPLLAGFHAIGANRLLIALTGVGVCTFAGFGASLVIDPALADQFDAGAVGYGLLTTVWGAGAVVGALVAGRVVTVERAPTAVVAGMTAMAVSLGSVAVLPTFALIVAVGAIGGAGNGFVNVPVLLLLQHHTNDRVRGRVVAAIESCEQVTFLLGMGVAAVGISVVHPQQAYAITGGALLLGTLFAVRAASLTSGSVGDGAVGERSELAPEVERA